MMNNNNINLTKILIFYLTSGKNKGSRSSYRLKKHLPRKKIKIQNYDIKFF